MARIDGPAPDYTTGRQRRPRDGVAAAVPIAAEPASAATAAGASLVLAFRPVKTGALVLLVLGMAMALEGLPYFVAPDSVRRGSLRVVLCGG